MAARGKKRKSLGRVRKAFKPKTKPKPIGPLILAGIVPFWVLAETIAKGLYYGILYDPEKAAAAKRKRQK